MSLMSEVNEKSISWVGKEIFNLFVTTVNSLR